jgi:hypothetical protein
MPDARQVVYSGHLHRHGLAGTAPRGVTAQEGPSFDQPTVRVAASNNRVFLRVVSPFDDRRSQLSHARTVADRTAADPSLGSARVCGGTNG